MDTERGHPESDFAQSSPWDRSVRVNRLTPMEDEAFLRAYTATMAKVRLGYRMFAARTHRLAPTASTVLDAATGPGYLLPHLARTYPDAAIHALDLSVWLLEQARRTIEKEPSSRMIRLHCGSVYQMPFADGVFDLVVNTQTLHFLDDLPGFFAEAHRVLKPEGRFVALAFRRDCAIALYRLAIVQSQWYRWRGRPIDGMGSVFQASYTHREVRDALQSAGFRDSKVWNGRMTLSVCATR